MSIAVDGLTDYAQRMKANNNASYSHPLVARGAQNYQDAFANAPTPTKPPSYPDNNNLLGPTPAPTTEPPPESNVGSPISSSTTQSAGSNPNNPQTLDAMPNMPTEAQLSSAGGPSTGGTGMDTPSQADQLLTKSEAPVGTPQLPDSLANPVQSDTDPLLQAGKTQLQQSQALLQQHQMQQRNALFNQQQNNVSSGTSDPQAIAGFGQDQLTNAQQIIQAGIQRGMSRGDIQTALMTSLAESGLRNLNYGDRDSVGLFQQRASQGWGNPQQLMDPSYSTGKFYDALSQVANRQSMTPWQAAQAVQRSAFADGSNYQAQFAQAQKLMAGLYDQQMNQGSMAAPTMAFNGSAQWINNNMNKYLDYDHAFGAQCVDLYAFYTSGFVGGNPYPVQTADQIWNHYDNNAYVRIASNQIPQMGDVAVYGKSGATPYSHVGIVIQDNGNGTTRTLSNNATSAGPNGNSAVVNISKASLLGYLRPRKLMI